MKRALFKRLTTQFCKRYKDLEEQGRLIVLKPRTDIAKDNFISALVNSDAVCPEDMGFEQEDSDCKHVDRLVKAIHKILLENKVTIRATSGADLLITDEETGEERVLPDLGFPF